MKQGSNIQITFGAILILGEYDREGRCGIIEGESISLPTQYQVSAASTVEAEDATISDGKNRSSMLELTTVQYFDTAAEAFAAFVAQERAWRQMEGNLAPLTIAGLGTFEAGVQSRTPAIVRHKELHISYAFACGSLTLETSSVP